MKGSIYLRKTNDPHWVVSWPEGKKRYKITHYLGEPDLMYQTNQNKKHDTGYKKAEKLLALMQGDVERNCFRIEKYTGGRLTDSRRWEGVHRVCSGEPASPEPHGRCPEADLQRTGMQGSLQESLGPSDRGATTGPGFSREGGTTW